MPKVTIEVPYAVRDDGVLFIAGDVTDYKFKFITRHHTSDYLGAATAVIHVEDVFWLKGDNDGGFDIVFIPTTGQYQYPKKQHRDYELVNINDIGHGVWLSDRVRLSNKLNERVKSIIYLLRMFYYGNSKILREPGEDTLHFRHVDSFDLM